MACSWAQVAIFKHWRVGDDPRLRRSVPPPPRWEAMSLPRDAVQSCAGAGRGCDSTWSQRAARCLVSWQYFTSEREGGRGPRRDWCRERSNVRNRCSTDLDPPNAASAPDDLQDGPNSPKNALARIYLQNLQRFKADFNLKVARTTKTCLDECMCLCMCVCIDFSVSTCNFTTKTLYD